MIFGARLTHFLKLVHVQWKCKTKSDFLFCLVSREDLSDDNNNDDDDDDDIEDELDEELSIG